MQMSAALHSFQSNFSENFLREVHNTCPGEKHISLQIQILVGLFCLTLVPCGLANSVDDTVKLFLECDGDVSVSDILLQELI